MQQDADLAPEQSAGAGRHAKRVFHGLRKPANWAQLIKFGLVGGSGFVLNIAVYTFAHSVLDINYLIASALAFCVAVTNNFFWNRHWTFDAREGHAGFQASRFFVVSLLSFAVVNLVLLRVLVHDFDVPKIPAQVIAVLCSMPFNFLGNKLWSFREHSSVDSGTDQ
jgi:dolichol-phosphate mannosyltransferase